LRDEQKPIERFSRGEEHVIYWGDVLQVLEECVPDHSIDLLFADPPYNIGKRYDSFLDRWESDESYADWCYQWLALGLQKLKPTGSLYVMASTQAMPYLDLFLRRRSTVLARIVWRYDSSGVQAKRKFGSMYEPILHCVMDPNQYTFNADAVRVDAPTGSVRRLIDYRKTPPVPYNSSKVPGNVWEFPRVRYRMSEYENHPTQKPESLLERIVTASSHPGDCVLDLFSGTFTASAVAKRLGRRSIGIEQSIEYVKIGLRRLSICEDFHGEPLVAIQKPYVRKNKSLP
jgi:site-specific DNA-methyltransferase (adenine-specific)